MSLDDPLRTRNGHPCRRARENRDKFATLHFDCSLGNLSSLLLSGRASVHGSVGRKPRFPPQRSSHRRASTRARPHARRPSTQRGDAMRAEVARSHSSAETASRWAATSGTLSSIAAHVRLLDRTRQFGPFLRGHAWPGAGRRKAPRECE